MFKTDGGGIALNINDAKITTSETASTWNTKLSQIGKTSGKVVICTYSLPDLDYMERIFNKRSENVYIIANSKFANKAKELEKKYPSLVILLRPDIHAKFVLIEPETVWLSSANFGKSGWFEQTIGIHSKEAYEFLLTQLRKHLTLKKERN